MSYTCPNGYTSEQAAEVSAWLLSDLPGSLMQQRVGDDGRTIEGNLTWTDNLQVGTVTHRFVWKMAALPPE